MLQVRSDLCFGCGVCKETCPRAAISIQSGKAYIDRTRCNDCGICLDLCPRNAIIKYAPVAREELKVTVDSLKQKAVCLMERIEKLKQNRSET